MRIKELIFTAICLTAALPAVGLTPADSVPASEPEAATLIQPADTSAIRAALEAPADFSPAAAPQKPKSCRNLYEMPYSATLSCPDWGRLMVNTGVLVGGGITTLVILEHLPEDATAWSRAEQKHHSMWERYRKHFKEGPVWDGDKFVFNFILHPYGGAAYYMGARSCGFNVWGSFLYSFCISTFFWEYGVECFMEIPSVQDLVVTPVIGSIFGECFYLAKRAILNNNYRLLGSKALGYVVAFLLDPLNELAGYFRGDQRRWCREHQSSQEPKLSMTPQIGAGRMGFSLSYTF